MMLARVVGNSVSTVKHPSYQGRTILVVQPINPKGEDSGKSFLAVDAVQAGVGDRVLVAREGNTAQQILQVKETPIHAIVVSIVDEIQEVS